MDLLLTQFCVVASFLLAHGISAEETVLSIQCGNATCQQGQLCCGNVTEEYEFGGPLCYWPEKETCCLAGNWTQQPPVICNEGQSCCGSNETWNPTCYSKQNETCCSGWYAQSSICPGTAAEVQCCPVWGPPQLFGCCNATAPCCSMGEGGSYDGVCCATESTTCCAGEYSVCCSDIAGEICCGGGVCCQKGMTCCGGGICCPNAADCETGNGCV